MKNLINDEAGFVISAELILVATITVLGLVVGLAEVRQAVSEELEDVAAAFGSLNQSYCFTGLQTSKAQTFGSHFRDHLRGHFRIGREVDPAAHIRARDVEFDGRDLFERIQSLGHLAELGNVVPGDVDDDGRAQAEQIAQVLVEKRLDAVVVQADGVQQSG